MTERFRLIAASYISTDPRSGYGADTSSYESFRSVRPFQLSVMSEVLNKRTARAVAVCRSPASAPRWSGVANAGPTRSRRRQISPRTLSPQFMLAWKLDALSTRAPSKDAIQIFTVVIKRRVSNVREKKNFWANVCSGDPMSG